MVQKVLALTYLDSPDGLEKSKVVIFDKLSNSEPYQVSVTVFIA